MYEYDCQVQCGFFDWEGFLAENFGFTSTLLASLLFLP